MSYTRKCTRFVAKKDVLINGRILAKALDLCVSGMFIHSHVSFPIGSLVDLDFSLYDAEPPIRIKGIVQHIKKGLAFGVQFQDISEETKARIESFIENACMTPTDGRKKILIVDDSINVRDKYRNTLEAEGFEVQEAADGREALEHIFHSMPDLVLLGLFMDGMDGFQFLEIVRSDERLKTLKIVVLTRALGPEVKERLAPYGILDFKTKMMTAPKALAEDLAAYFG